MRHHITYFDPKIHFIVGHGIGTKEIALGKFIGKLRHENFQVIKSVIQYFVYTKPEVF